MSVPFPPTRLSAYTPRERLLNSRLHALFTQWHAFLLRPENAGPFRPEYFAGDGLFPRYTLQKLKILYIGRESLNIRGQHHSDLVCAAYRNNRLDGRPMGQHAFHRRLVRITYGLLHRGPAWEDIPPAEELMRGFAAPGGISCAVMNISKLSHEFTDNPDWPSDWKIINAFLRVSARSPLNFHQEEIRILNPDLVISMNLPGHLKYLGDVELLAGEENVRTYALRLDGRCLPVLDTWHFCARKTDATALYLPLVHAARRLAALEAFCGEPAALHFASP